MKSLNDDDFHNELIDLLQELKVVSGIVLPSEQDLLETTIKILTRFLRTSYLFPFLTMGEVKFAFYINHQGGLDQIYNHYNREITCKYLGDVLRAYIALKRSIYNRLGTEIRQAVLL